MKRLVEWAGVDYTQWRVLVRTFLKIDFGALLGAQGSAAATKTALGLLLTCVIYGLTGLMPALAIWASPDLLLGAAIMTTIVGFMVASTLLMGDGAAIASPDDHNVLGFRPITSRTYLAVRITSMFIRTLAIATLVGYPAAIAFLFKDGLHPAAAFAALAANYGTAAAVTLAMVAMYGWLLRIAGPTRVLRLMSYAQLVATTMTWGGLLAITQGFGRHLLSGVTLSGNLWAFLYPGTWFASYVSLARGRAGLLELVAVGLSLLLLAALVRSISGKLSLEYVERLSRLTTAAAPAAVAERPSRWLGILGSETRAVAILVRSQFRYDMKFRLGLLSIVPITFIYLFLGTRGGSPADPFVAGASHGNETGFIQLAMMFLPMSLRRTLVTSESYRASWIFYTSPADRTRLALAARDIITLFFLVPYLTLLAGIFTYFFHNALHAVVHAFFLGFLAYLVVQFGVMINPQLPFSLPVTKDTNAGMNFGMMMVVMMIGYAMYFFVTFFVYRTPLRMVVTLAGLLAVAWLMDRTTRARAERRLGDLSYLA